MSKRKAKAEPREDRIKTPFGFYLPRWVTVGALTYEVRDVPDMRTGTDIGRCDHERQRLLIDIGYHHTASALLTTWHHETGHIIQHVYKLEVTEADTDRMAQGCTEALGALIDAQ